MVAEPTRADVRRNRDKLVVAARRLLTDAVGTVPLEAIAREAGVGIATLYRHFPQRDDLVEAVYRSELATLCDGAADLVADRPADRALREWMGRYADFVATKRRFGEALRTVIASGAITSAQTRAQMGEAVEVLLAAGQDDGTLRDDVRADDLVAALAGVILAADGADPEQAARVQRLLDLLVAGSAR